MRLIQIGPAPSHRPATVPHGEAHRAAHFGALLMVCGNESLKHASTAGLRPAHTKRHREARSLGPRHLFGLERRPRRPHPRRIRGYDPAEPSHEPPRVVSVSLTSASARLPVGMRIHELVPHPDARGMIMECFRESWPETPRLIQWNMVSSAAGVLRGFRVHVRHTDYLLVAEGGLTLGVRDIRPGSPTHGTTALLKLVAAVPVAVTIPPGIAHGFCFFERSVLVLGVSEYWNADDELGCHWADPQIGIAWPIREPILSSFDEQAGSFAAMVDRYETRAREIALAAAETVR